MFDLVLKYSNVFKDINNYLLLAELEKFVNGAILQVDRIRRSQKALVAGIKEYKTKNSRNTLQRLFLDAHFYFICIGQVNKFLGQLSNNLKNKKITKIYSNFKKEFNKEIRDHLEHLDERVLGKMYDKAVDPEVAKTWNRDFVNFMGDQLSFGGKRYPANRMAIKRLSTIYEGIVSVIHTDYGLKNRQFIEREQSTKVTKSLEKWLENFSRVNN